MRKILIVAAPLLFQLQLLRPAMASTTTGAASSEMAFYSAPARATADYYAAPYGNDANSCTSISAPCATLDGVRRKMAGQTGKTAMFRGGYYYSQSTSFGPGDSGLPGSPNVYTNYPGERPVLSAGALATGWTPCSSLGAQSPYYALSNCYAAPITSGPNFEQLWYNGVRRNRARNSASIADAQSGYLLMTGGSYNSGTCTGAAATMTFSASDVRSLYYNPEDVEIISFPSWITQRSRICSVAGSTVTFTGIVSSSGAFTFASGKKYLIENSREDFIANATPQTWYLDCGQSGASGCVLGAARPWTLVYLAAANENPASAQIVVPNLTNLMTFSAAHDLIFQGLSLFVTGNFVIPQTGLNDQTAQFNVPADISCLDCTNVVFDGDVVHGTTAVGLEFVSDQKATGLTGDEVLNSVIYDAGSIGLRVGRNLSAGVPSSGDTLSNTVSGWTVQNTAFSGMQRFIPGGIGGCITVNQGHDGTINHNSCLDTYNGAIGIGVATNPTLSSCDAGGFVCLKNINIQNNYFSDLGHGVTFDFGCVHFSQSSNTGDLFTGNVCHDIVADIASSIQTGYGNGIYIDNSAQNVVATNNLVYNTTGALLFVNGSQDTATTGAPTPGGPCSQLDPVASIPTCNNVISNNIFAFGIQGAVRRGPASTGPRSAAYRSFTYSHNLVYQDLGPFQVSNVTGQGPGSWGCQVGTLTATYWPGPCSNYYNFAANVWYSTLGQLTFLTTDPTSGTGDQNLTRWNFGAGSCNASAANYWQAGAPCPAEDGAAGGSPAGSMQADPGFVNATGRNFALTGTGPGSAEYQVGFADFTSMWQAAGRTSALLGVPVVPQTFPNQPVSAF
jgi:hypothetical protein